MATTPKEHRGSAPPGGTGRVGGDATPRGVWLLVGTIACAKLATFGVVLWAAAGPEAGVLIGVSLPPWLMAGALLMAAPVLFRIRLRRVRARRDRLHRAEWLLPEPKAAEARRVRRALRPLGSLWTLARGRPGIEPS